MPSTSTRKPLYHWDPTLRTLVPVPPGDARKRQPAIDATTFDLIHALYRRYNGSAEAVYRATSWSTTTIDAVMECATYAEFQEARTRFRAKMAARRERRLATADTHANAEHDEMLALELAALPADDTAALPPDALVRIVSALEGIDVSLRAIRDDTRQSLELSQKLYDLWKPSLPVTSVEERPDGTN